MAVVDPRHRRTNAWKKICQLAKRQGLKQAPPTDSHFQMLAFWWRTRCDALTRFGSTADRARFREFPWEEQLARELLVDNSTRTLVRVSRSLKIKDFWAWGQVGPEDWNYEHLGCIFIEEPSRYVSWPIYIATFLCRHFRAEEFWPKELKRFLKFHGHIPEY